MWESLRERGQPLFGNVQPPPRPDKQIQLFPKKDLKPGVLIDWPEDPDFFRP
jgi:hypothetical protein